MDTYDVIVVGTGLSGIVAAIKYIHEGLNVLLLDEHNYIGGMSKSFKKGRFEFGNTFHNMYLSNSKSSYTLKNILDKYNINDGIKMANIPSLGRIITDSVDITLPFGVENYINKIESIVPGSQESLQTMFKLAKECKEAMEYIASNLNNLDTSYIKDVYNNFARVCNASQSRVMDELGVPLKAQEIVNALWIIWGVSETEISFVTYSTFLLDILNSKICVPVETNYEISLMLINNYLEQAGVLKLNSKVVKLLVDDNRINGVKLDNGSCYYANKVVVNSNMRNVYGNLLSQNEVPHTVLRNINKRELGGRTFTVHLGLNRSYKEFGFDNYLYFIYNSLDSDAEVNRMSTIDNNNEVVIIEDILDRQSSLSTCRISISTVFFSDCFAEGYDEEDILEREQEIAHNLIRIFEEYTHINIYDFIEEIAICSPLHTAKTTGLVSGADYGFSLKGLDSVLPRMLNSHNEQYIEGLEVVSGFDGDIYGFASSFYEGGINNGEN